MERESALRLELVELEREYRQEVQKSPTSQNPERLRLVEQQIEQKRLAYEEFLITLKAKNPEYASLVTVMPLSLKEVQKLLDQDTTLLAYVVASDKTIAFVITKRRFETVELPIGEDALMPAVVNVRKPAGAYDPIPEDLNKLYTRLITPLKPYLKTAKLGIIPHGVLHYLPFAALTDGKHYLSDEYILFFLPSVTVLKFIQEQRKFSDHTVLAMANGHAAGLPELIFAAEEVQAIATYSNTRLFISPKAATETAFKELASQFSILHLAAHAQLNLTNPLFSRILLTSDDQNDGALEVHEIYELDLHHAEMVVLSACETTLGKQSRGDDIIGLTRAFMYAGAPTVIASLWKVEDLATYEFMAAFYQQLRRGNSKADALRNAQKLTRKNYPHPYYWAAFMLTGDPGTMPE
jgi:CHAT domain-containing protein